MKWFTSEELQTIANKELFMACDELPRDLATQCLALMEPCVCCVEVGCFDEKCRCENELDDDL